MRETDREKDKHRQTGGKTQLHLQTDTRSCARTHRHINASQYSAHKTHRPWGATFFTNHPLFPNLSFVKLMWRLWETIRVGMDFFISECVLLTPGSAVAQNWSKTGTDKDSKLSADQNFQAFGIFYLASFLSRHERRTFAPVVSQLWQTRRTARAAGGVTWDAPASAVSTLQLLPISIIWCHDWGHHGASRGQHRAHTLSPTGRQNWLWRTSLSFSTTFSTPCSPTIFVCRVWWCFTCPWCLLSHKQTVISSSRS